MRISIVFCIISLLISCGMLMGEEFEEIIELFKARAVPVGEAEFEQAKSDFKAEFDSLLNECIPFRSSKGWEERFVSNPGLILRNGFYELQVGEDGDKRYYSIAGLGNKTWNDQVCFMGGIYDQTEKAIFFISDDGPSPESCVNIFDIKELYSDSEAPDTEVEDAEISEEAQRALSSLRRAYHVYLQTNGSLEGFSPGLAVKDAGLCQEITKNWSFAIYCEAKRLSPRIYLAISTADNPAGEGMMVWYDAGKAMFHGFGIDSQCEPELNALLKR